MAGDPYWNNVVLAMHMDGANASTTFPDLKGHTITAAGNAKISTAQSKFGGASALFDGAGDYLNIAASTDLVLGTGDFTIECWINIIAYGGSGAQNDSTLFGLQGTSGGFFMYSRWSDGALCWFDGATGLSSTSGIQMSTWTHVAVTRSAGTLRLFENGTLKASRINYFYNIASGVTQWRVGGNAFGDSTRYFNGYIDDLRVTNGVARYTADFAPPTEAFPSTPPQISGTVKDSTGAFVARTVRAYRRSDGAFAGQTVSNATTGAYSITTLDGTPHFAVVHDGAVVDSDPYWNNVVLAMHMDDTGLTDIKGHAVTRVGNAARSSTQSKFGGYSAFFDGVGDYLTLPNTPDFDFAGEFTIEFWAYMSAYGASWSCVISRYNDTTPSGWRIILPTSGGSWQFSFVDSGGTVRGYAGQTLSVGQWYHLAVTFDGANYRTFTNGTLNATISNALPPKSVGTSYSPFIGATNTAAWHLNGYIDDLRITKGVARYTTSFTPPVSPFQHALVPGSPTENALILDNITPL